MRNKTDVSKKRNEGAMTPLHSLFALIICALLSVVLWLYVMDYDSPDFEKKFSQVPVKVTGVSELSQNSGMTLLSDVEFEFEVTVSGKKGEVNSLRTEDIQATIDVSNVYTPGGVYIPINVMVPNGISVKSQSVESAYVVIDQRVSMEIPVKAELFGYTLPENGVMEDPVIAPETVTLLGPKAKLEKIDHAYVRIEPGELAGSVTVNAEYVLRDSQNAVIQDISYITKVDSSVSVTVPVLATKMLPIKVQFIGGVFGTDNAVIKLSETSVKVVGTSMALASLDEIVLNIDETTLDPVSTLIKKIILPDGIKNASGYDTVTVNITLNQMGRRTVSAERVDFVLKNVPEGIDVQFITETLHIEFFGPVDLMRYFDSNSFTVEVDLEGMHLESGENIFVPVNVVINPDVQGVYVSGDYSVNIIVN